MRVEEPPPLFFFMCVWLCGHLFHGPCLLGTDSVRIPSSFVLFPFVLNTYTYTHTHHGTIASRGEGHKRPPLYHPLVPPLA